MPDQPNCLRIHFVAHHYRDRAAGASGATQALGDALAARGCEVSYFHFDDAFGSASGAEIPRMLRFPWHVAAHLARTAASVDVIDATTGDAWVWCKRGRAGGANTALITRSHGLEHVSVEDMRRRASRGEVKLSRKYPLYHGGYRLWEVRQSLARSDSQIFLNEQDRAYAVRRLGVSEWSSVVIPNGVPDRLLDLELPEPVATNEPIALAFIGSWIPRKGTATVTRALGILASRGIPFSARLLGTGVNEREVLAQFPADVRGSIFVTPRYAPDDLPALVTGAEVLLHPSWTEGFSLALVEGMACGLAPIATHSGGAASIVCDGETGLLLSSESGDALADAIARLAGDRDLLVRMRRRARASTLDLRWASIAERTLVVYQEAVSRRAASSGHAA